MMKIVLFNILSGSFLFFGLPLVLICCTFSVFNKFFLCVAAKRVDNDGD